MDRRDERVKLRETGVSWQQVDDETVVLDVQSSTYIGVNSSGSVLWPAMVAGATRAELAALLRSAFEVSEEQAQADVDAFVEGCRARGLLEP